MVVVEGGGLLEGVVVIVNNMLLNTAILQLIWLCPRYLSTGRRVQIPFPDFVLLISDGKCLR